MRNIIFIVNILFVVFSLSTAPLDISFIPINPADELPDRFVSSVVQDSKGFLWLGTHSGLVRYDGYKFKLYEKQPYTTNTIPHNLVQTLFMDKGDILWIGTYGGMARFDTSTGNIQTYIHIEDDDTTLSNAVITNIFRDRKGFLWVSTLNGLNVMDETGGTFKRIMHAENDDKSLSSNVVRSVIEDTAGNIWVGTANGGLNRLTDRDKFEFKHYRMGKEDDSGILTDAVMTLAIDEYGFLWAGCWMGGLSRYDEKSDTFDDYKIDSCKIYKIFPDKGSRLFIATWGDGVCEFDSLTGKTKIYKNDPDKRGSLPNNVVCDIFRDRLGILWVTTNGGGIFRANSSSDIYDEINIPETIDSMAKVCVTAVLEGSDGKVYIGLYNGGLNVYDPVKNKIRSYIYDPADPYSIRDNIVNSIYEFDGKIWVLTNGGIHTFDSKTGRFELHKIKDLNKNLLSSIICFSITGNNKGDLWVGTATDGVLYYDKKTDTFIPVFSKGDGVNSGLTDNMVYSLLIDSKDRLWVGTNDGLNLIENSVIKRYLYNPENRSGISSSSIAMVYEDKDGSIWINTRDGGVCRYLDASDTFFTITKDDGLQNNSVSSFIEDYDGNMWFAFRCGMMIYDKTKNKLRSVPLSSADDGVRFSSGAFRSRDGELLFGGDKCIYRFYPGNVKYSDYSLPVVITDVVLLNKQDSYERVVSCSDTINVKYAENNVTFMFSSLDYQSPSQSQYAYMLDGFDNDWIYCGNKNSANYTNIPGGKYHFKVKGTGYDGNWNGYYADVKINIKKHLLTTWIAYFIYILFFTGMVSYLSSIKWKKLLKVKSAELTNMRIELGFAKQKLRNLVDTDIVTGLGNRKVMNEILVHIYNNCYKNAEPVSVILFDIDCFDRYNNYYGCQKGDELLQIVSGVINGSLDPATDFAARYNGGQFLILMDGVSLNKALSLSEEVKLKVFGLGIKHEYSTVARVVTVSFGVASRIPDAKDGYEELLVEAGESLLKMKSESGSEVSSG